MQTTHAYHNAAICTGSDGRFGMFAMEPYQQVSLARLMKDGLMVDSKCNVNAKWHQALITQQQEAKWIALSSSLTTQNPSKTWFTFLAISVQRRCRSDQSKFGWSKICPLVATKISGRFRPMPLIAWQVSFLKNLFPSCPSHRWFV